MNDKVKKIVDNLPANISLYHETQDKEQLKPTARLLSIFNVLSALGPTKLGNPKTAIDIWSWFGYGVLVLDALWVKSIGVENISLKYNQALRLFNTLHWIQNIDFDQAPGLINQDFLQIKTDTKVDLLTVFYTSDYFADESSMLKYKELLTDSWVVLAATEIDIDTIAQLIQQKSYINQYFDIELVEIKDNFEKTAILLTPLQ